MPFRGIEEYLHDIIENIEAARSLSVAAHWRNSRKIA
jgi:hypothetical protein